MNFLDTYDITRSPTPQPTSAPEQPSLNEEVNQVIGQLGRFWGGFRKQSQTVLEVARKDFGEVVMQAQKELSKLTTDAAAVPDAASTERGEAASTSSRDVEGPSNDAEGSLPEERAIHEDDPSSSSLPQASLFSRLQSALPPNIVATVNSTIPESLKHATDNVDFAGIRSNLLTEFQRVQGVTRAQAEEYVHKSEALLREAYKEAGEVLKDAVKVIPPEQVGTSAGGTASTALVWDGTDMWMLPSEASTSELSTVVFDSQPRQSGDTQRAVATRAEALLRRLQRDPSIISHDPEAEAKEKYRAWLEAEVEPKEGGIEGAKWGAKVSEALDEPHDGQALKDLQDTLVPSVMTRSVFWSRYFFRVHQIRQEEEKRKALVAVSSDDTEDDFSWEDNEDDAPTPAIQSTATFKAPTKLPNGELSPPASQLLTGTTSSPRLSSEDGFDVVSSANVSVAGEPSKTNTPSDDGDSDWE